MIDGLSLVKSAGMTQARRGKSQKQSAGSVEVLSIEITVIGRLKRNNVKLTTLKG
jgi:hypothetical protein